MRGLVHLKRRPSGVYLVGLVVPAWLRPAAAQREVHRSTGCRDLALAKMVAAALAADWHSRLARLRKMDPKKLKAGAVELPGDGLPPLLAAAALIGATPKGLAERLDRRHAPFFVNAMDWEGWLIPDLADLYVERDTARLRAWVMVPPRLMSPITTICNWIGLPMAAEHSAMKLARVDASGAPQTRQRAGHRQLAAAGDGLDVNPAVVQPQHGVGSGAGNGAGGIKQGWRRC